MSETWGSIADWVAALATVATVVAIFYARKTLLMEQEKRAHELEREAKHQASQLSAWVVAHIHQDRPNDYGMVVDNASGAIFHDVEVKVMLHEREVEQPVRLTVLPPGRYFVQHGGGTSPFSWQFPSPLTDEALAGLRPYMNSPKYRVLSVTYGDALHQRWEQDRFGRLAPARAETPQERSAA